MSDDNTQDVPNSEPPPVKVAKIIVPPEREPQEITTSVTQIKKIEVVELKPTDNQPFNDPESRDSLAGYWTPRQTIRRKLSDSETNLEKRNKEAMKLKQHKRTMSAACLNDFESKIGIINNPARIAGTSNRTRFLEEKHRNYSADVLHLDVAKLELERMTQQLHKSSLNPSNRHLGTSLSSLNDATRVQFGIAQTPPMVHPSQPTFSPVLRTFGKEHRGELDMAEKYNYDLSKAQLKASSRTSALLAGFAMVALVELQYDEDTPKPLLIVLGVVTSLLVSVHLLALMMSTCILPYMEATGCTQDSPHLRLKFYIDLSWLFSTCIGLLLFLVEIAIIFFVKFDAVGYRTAGYITTAMIIPVVVIFILFSYLIHKNRVSHSLGRFKHKVDTMKQLLDVEAQLSKSAPNAAIGASVIKEF
ncbi:unnamed protein product [Auanema sp. JU1783]|nr:unnamed protein product [Auanema sp. JU1783]